MKVVGDLGKWAGAAGYATDTTVGRHSNAALSLDHDTRGSACRPLVVGVDPKG